MVGFGWLGGETATAAVGINQQLNFQGRLLNAAGAVVADGTYNIEFKIYQDGDGAPGGAAETLKWTEDRVYGTGSPDRRVTVRNGYFAVALGSVTAFGTSVDWNQDTLWLTINVGDTSQAASFAAANGDGEMTPYKRLTTAAYAMQAASCTTCVLQAPTSTAQNTIAPTVNSVVGLTVNATSGTTAVAVAVNQSKTSDALVVSSTNTSGTQTNGILFNRNGSGGTTTNGVNITQTAGTLSAGLNFSGTIGTDILRGSGTLTMQGFDGISLNTGDSPSSSTGAITIQSGNASLGSNLSAGTVTIDTGTKTGSGTAILNLGNTRATTLNIGNSAVANTINFGNNVGASATNIFGGTGHITLQTNSSSASILAKSSTNAATAFQVQDSGAASLLTVDTTARSASGGNLVKIGNSTGTDTATTILQLDAASAVPTSNLSALNGGLFYNSNTAKLSIIEGGAVKVLCNTTDLGCGTGGGGSLQAAYTASTGGTTPEVLLDTTRNGLDIQDANTTLGATVPLLAVRAPATASTLGNILFDVQGNGRVGINLGGASTTTTYDLSFGNGANRTIGVETATSGAGKSLTVQGGGPSGTNVGGSAILLGGSSYGAAFTAKGSSSTAFDDTGGDAEITGGSGGGSGGGLLRVSGSFFNSNLGTTDGGNILLQAGSESGGGIPGAVTVKNGANYATAFQIQNTSSLAVLTADTSGLAVQIGLATTDANAVELVVDGYNGTSDPTGANGAIYYNTGGRGGAGGTSAYSGKFRCFEGNVWKDCIGMRDIADRRWMYWMVGGMAATTIYPMAMDLRNEVGTIAASKQTESIYLRYTNGGSGTDGGIVGVLGPGYTDTETRYLPKLTTRIRVDATSVGASTRYWVGLFEGTPMGFDAPTTSAAQTIDYIGVGSRDNVNSGKWLCASGDGTNHTGTDMGVTVTANHYYDIIVDLSTAGTLVCSISDNGGPFTTVTKTTNLPGTSVDMGIVEATRSVSAVTRAISIAYGYLEYQ